MGGLVCSIDSGLSGREFLDAPVQSALVASSLVLGHDALIDHAVDDRDCRLVRSLGGFLVSGVTGFHDILDTGTHHRAQAHVVLAGLLRLAGALLR